MGRIVRVQCKCGLDCLLHIGSGLSDTMKYLNSGDEEYRYWVLNIDTNALECLTSATHINTIPDVISEEDIEQALSGEKKILCVSCQKYYFSISQFGFWD